MTSRASRATKTSAGRRAILVATVATLAALAQIPAHAATLVVEDANLQTWQFQHATCGAASTATSSFEVGPDTAPLGAGSLEFEIGANGDSYETIRYPGLAGTPLTSLTALSYSTYVTSNFDSQAPYVLLNVDNDGDAIADDLLFFEPAYQNPGFLVPDQGLVTTGTWQTWDALVGGWWSLNAGTFGPPLVSLADYATANPLATIVNDGANGGLRIATGCGGGAWAGFEGNLDALTIGVSGTDTTFDFDLDVVAPDPVVILTPAEEAGFAPGSSVTVSGTAEPGSTVKIAEIGTFSGLATTTAAPDGTFSVILNGLAEKRWVITATAEDAAGNVSHESNRTFDIDRNVPTILSPLPGTLNPGVTTASGLGKVGATVQVFEGTTKLATTVVTSQGRWFVDLPFTSGTHTIKARGTSVTGNPSFSAPVTFTVDATRPTVAITTTAAQFGPTDTVTIAGTGADNDQVVRVEVAYYNLLGTRVLATEGTCPTCPAPSVTWDNSPTLLPGRYTVQAVAIDNAGNRSLPASFTFLKLSV